MEFHINPVTGESHGYSSRYDVGDGNYRAWLNILWPAEMEFHTYPVTGESHGHCSRLDVGDGNYYYVLYFKLQIMGLHTVLEKLHYLLQNRRSMRKLRK